MIYRVIKRVVSHQIVLIEAENKEEADMLQGDELTVKDEEEDVEVVSVRPATAKEKREYRKHYPR